MTGDVSPTSPNLPRDEQVMADPHEPAAPHGADATHASTTAEHGSGGGIPQFEFQHWGGQIAYLLVLFAILYVLISRVFAPRLRKVIDDRASTISDAVATAKQVQAESEELARAAATEVAEARAQSQRLAAEARAKASAEAAATSAAADAETAGKVAEAEARIAAMRDSAMSSVGAVAEEITKAIVEKLTGKAATAAEVKAAGGAA
jgi:F-type H+-transporting ATPase subunit b